MNTDKYILWEIKKAIVGELKAKVNSLNEIYESEGGDKGNELAMVKYIESSVIYLDQLLNEERMS